MSPSSLALSASSVPGSSTVVPPQGPAAPAGAAGTLTACGDLDLSNPPAGINVTTTAVLGTTEVTLAGTTVLNPGQATSLSAPVLTVKQRGVVVGTSPVAPPAAPPPDQTAAVMPWRVGPKPPPGGEGPNDVVCLAQFPSWTMPAVIMGLWTGGAHCCLYVRAIPMTVDGLTTPVEQTVGNAAASLTVDGDTPIIVTADDSFTYVFAPFSRSGMPLRVLSFGSGGIVDVTSQHRSLIADDAGMLFSRFEDSPSDGLGYLAAWVGDQCMLGQARPAWHTVDELQKQGKLSGIVGWPGGSDYVRTLRAFLAQHNYCTGG